MKKIDITGLSNVPETMLITVRARAIETEKANGLVNDPFAKKILSRISAQESVKEVVSPQSQLGVCIRTEFLDNVVKEFLAKHPDGTVVNLGCGLDARYERLNNGAVQWYDIDLPESINVRKSFFEEQENYKMIAKSALDFSWMKKIPKSKPQLFLSEGVLMYLPPTDVENLFREMAEQFPGSELAFDLISPMVVKNSHRHPDVKKYNANFLWGAESIEDLKLISPKIIPLKSENMMEIYPRRWPLWMQFMSIIPSIRKDSKLVKISFAS